MVKNLPPSSLKKIFEKVRAAGFPIKTSDQNIDLAFQWLYRIEMDELVEGFKDGNLTRYRKFKNQDIRWHLIMVEEYGYRIKGTESVEFIIQLHDQLKTQNSN